MSDEREARLEKLATLRAEGIDPYPARSQIYFKRDTIGDDAFRRLKLIDLGDFLQVAGTLFTTKTGEKTLAVQQYELLSKSLTPLPAKGAGGDLKLFDPEVRHRK